MFYWLKDNEITAFADSAYPLPAEYGEIKETDREIVNIGGRLYFADTKEAAAAQKAFDKLFEEE